MDNELRSAQAKALLSLALKHPAVFNQEAVWKSIEKDATEAGKSPFEYLFEPSLFFGTDMAFEIVRRYRPELVIDRQDVD